MDKIDKIRQEIERQMRYAKNANYPKSSIENEMATEIVAVCLELLSFLDTLSEEPDKSMEEAAEEQAKSFGYMSHDREFKENVESFIVGAKWQNERMAKSMPLPEDTVLFQKGVAEGRRLEREDMTWQDCKRIVEIADALTEYAEAGIIEPFLASEEAYYTEVLRKFKEDGK